MKTQKKITEGYAIATDVEKKFFLNRATAEKYIKRINKIIPTDCQMKEEDIYRTNNEK